MENLMSLKFWFDLKPPALLPEYQSIFIIFILFLFVVFVFLKIIKKRKFKVYSGIIEKTSYFLLVNLVVGLFLLFFNYEGVPFLSSRFLFLLWILGMASWVVYLFNIFKLIPEKKKKFEEEKEFKKYIP